MRHPRWSLLFALVAFVAFFGAACGSSDNSVFPGSGMDGGLDDDATSQQDGDPFFGDSSTDATTGPLVITPADQTLVVTSGTAVPTLSLVATLYGAPVTPVWTIDRGEIGAIGVASGVFTPAGTLGGKATISANFNGNKGTTSVTVKLIVIQNGAPAGVDAGTGAGGIGGVGGEGFGGPVSDPGNKQVLLGAPAVDTGLAFLYPYTNTVWPRGVLPPLLQWQPGAHGTPTTYDAVYIHITEAAYEYQGFFNKTTPTALAPTFMHHPIPQDVWKQVGSSNGGEDVTITLVFAAGGVAYGPVTETWKIANGPLKGTVYYNSYGTRLAKQLNTAVGGDHLFGGATLAIHAGQTDPVPIAGDNGDSSHCRVCHSVSANGGTLITQWGSNNDKETSVYDLKTSAETPMGGPIDSRYAWAAPSPDGAYMFTNAAPLSGASVSSPSVLYSIPSGALITSNSPADLRAGSPAFSPDGKNVAFNWYAGAGGGDTKSLAMMTFAAPGTFGAVTNLYTPGAGTALYPSFLPTNDGVVFELETRSNGRFGETRSDSDPGDIGSKAELWWLDTATKMPVRLDKLNGLGYLPTGPNAHDNDTVLNYEPTVNPVPSGGYAWVVFTSRRLYGNVATINPWHSDPRNYDLTQTPTPKKLWVAAIDLHAPAGTDPSHPAFYLPAQEILAANSRGYWVVDPCKTDGVNCETGDECCGGFCRPASDGGGLVCTAEQPSCAQEFEKCAVTADCCGASAGFTCVGGHCSRPTPH